jgi:hypothetical protein
VLNITLEHLLKLRSKENRVIPLSMIKRKTTNACSMLVWN